MAHDISDDFYGYVNGTWMTKVEIPASESRLMQAYYIREQIDDELNEIIRRENREGKGPIAEFLRSWDTQSQSGTAFP
jgi:predicted metalloendopeptidase